jgi:hypothetical protein
MLGTTTAVRGLTADDLASVRALLDRDPGVNVFLRYRVDSTALRDRFVGARVWGYFDGPDLVAACHAGSNIVPAEAGSEAVEAFAAHVLTEGIRPASIAGLQSAVLPLWEQLAPFLGPARSVRAVQPFLAIDHEPHVAPDPRVRRVTMDEIDILYPACVSMFREEVGIDPEADGLATNSDRVAEHEKLVATVEAAFADQDAEPLLARLAELGVPAGKVRSLDEVYTWDQVASQGLLVDVEHPQLGTLTLPGPPLRFFDPAGAEVTRRDHGAPPLLDQHADDLRAWLEEE